MFRILDVDEKTIFDDHITSHEFHSRKPDNHNFGKNDIITAYINHQDVYSWPAESYIRITGTVTGGPNSQFINNGIAFLFEELRYLINGEIVDSSRDLGLTTTIKGYLSLTSSEIRNLCNACWLDPLSQSSPQIMHTNGDFEAIIPLKILLGFAEDYGKVIMNVKQELIFVRKRTDDEALITTEAAAGVAQPTGSVEIKSISWRVPYIKVSDERRIRLLKSANNLKMIAFRSWDLYQHPSLPKTRKHNWTVKTTNSLERPRYVIVCFQKGRNNTQVKNSAHFDHCNVRSVKLFLNSECFPYESLDLDFSKNNIGILYDMYQRFQSSYYYEKKSGSCLNRETFLAKCPMFVIDCSKQSETIKSGSVDVSLEIETSEEFPENTTAQCLIIHDKMIQYHPIIGQVTRIV